jgi:GTP-binding protein YchF
MQIGIIGLPNSTKTTIFSALTRENVQTQPFSTGKFETQTAVVDVPDPRVDHLAAMFQPRKTTRAQVQYNDIAGLDSGVNHSGGFSGALLNAIAVNDALLHVVRAFRDDAIPHIRGSVDPARDLRDLDAELILADLGVVERRMERLQRELKRPGPAADLVKVEQELLLHLKDALENETPLRDIDLTGADQQRLRGFGFLTLKPVLVVLNVGDDGPLDSPAILPYPHQRSAVIALRGGIEREIAQMDEASAELFLSEYGIGEPSLRRMIRLSYDLLGVQSFFTVGEDEVRAWTMPRGGTALDAAGAIHTDLARGFIRAKVIGYDDLVQAGSLGEATQRGLLRLEGRDYVVQDGDVVEIRFNV